MGRRIYFVSDGHGLRFLTVKDKRLDANRRGAIQLARVWQEGKSQRAALCDQGETSSRMRNLDCLGRRCHARGTKSDKNCYGSCRCRISLPIRSQLNSQDEHCIFFSDGKPWKLQGWSSDAEFLYWGPVVAATKRTLIFCKGTYVEWSGHAIVTAKRTVLRCEVIESGNQFEIISSDPDAVVVNREGWTTLLAKDSPQLAGKLTAGEKS